MKMFAMAKCESYKKANLECMLKGFNASETAFHHMVDGWKKVEELLESKHPTMEAKQVLDVNRCSEQMVKGFMRCKELLTGLREMLEDAPKCSEEEFRNVVTQCKHRETQAASVFGGIVRALKELQYHIAGIVKV